jgi:hypothetical protein
MFRIFLRVFLSALIFVYIVPVIPGAHFIGQFFTTGLLYGMLMGCIFAAMVALITLATVGTIGATLLVMAPILAFRTTRYLAAWLLSTIQLVLLAHFFPGCLSFDTWSSAFVCGLVFLVMHVLTDVV